MRRATIGVLAAFHLLQASWLLQGGIDVLFPRTVEVKAGADTCCSARCGCPAEAQKRRSCCCYPEGAPAAETRQVPVSAFDEARCAGAEAALAAFFHPPTLPLPVLPPLFVPQVFRLELPERRPAHAPRDAALDKVPLA